MDIRIRAWLTMAPLLTADVNSVRHTRHEILVRKTHTFTVTRSKPGSMPKRTQLKFRVSHFEKAWKLSYSRMQRKSSHSSETMFDGNKMEAIIAAAHASKTPQYAIARAQILSPFTGPRNCVRQGRR